MITLRVVIMSTMTPYIFLGLNIKISWNEYCLPINSAPYSTNTNLHSRYHTCESSSYAQDNQHCGDRLISAPWLQNGTLIPTSFLQTMLWVRKHTHTPSAVPRMGISAWAEWRWLPLPLQQSIMLCVSEMLYLDNTLLWQCGILFWKQKKKKNPKI